MGSWAGSNTVDGLNFKSARGRKKACKGALLDTQNEKLASVFSRCARWSYSTNFKPLATMLLWQLDQRTLQLFLHPPPLPSDGFGGLHFQDHSNDTDEQPPVE